HNDGAGDLAASASPSAAGGIPAVLACVAQRANLAQRCRPASARDGSCREMNRRLRRGAPLANLPMRARFADRLTIFVRAIGSQTTPYSDSVSPRIQT